MMLLNIICGQWKNTGLWTFQPDKSKRKYGCGRVAWLWRWGWRRVAVEDSRTWQTILCPVCRKKYPQFKTWTEYERQLQREEQSRPKIKCSECGAQDMDDTISGADCPRCGAYYCHTCQQGGGDTLTRVMRGQSYLYAVNCRCGETLLPRLAKAAIEGARARNRSGPIESDGE
jgi:hypothetical protein